MSSWTDNLYIFAMFIPLVALHEAAHAWTARWLGDDTAEMEGRLTLNPLSHLELWGTLIVPALSLFAFQNSAPLAWGRPVPVDPSNLAHPRRDEIVIALAGPAANFLIGLLGIAASVYLVPADSIWQKPVLIFAFVSIALSLFHLLPLPWLDGWTIARNLLGLSSEAAYWGTGNLWIYLLLAIFVFSPLLSILRMMAKVLVGALHLLLGGGPLPAFVDL